MRRACLPPAEPIDVSTEHSELAKLSVPRLPGVVPRVRQFAQLDDHRSRPLIRIEGPPGAGKTTLVSSWLESRIAATLWYQVDAGDSDPASVFDYLSKGLGADPIVEAFHQGLMRCYQTLERPTEAVAAYPRLRHTLSVVLGVAPSAESERLHRKILASMVDQPEGSGDPVG